MHIHILGICGTFMAGIARLAVEQGFKVTGSDKAAYPPMSSQLEQLGISILPADDLSQLSPIPDQVVIGNALSRGNVIVEHILNHKIPYISGPQWLYENILHDKTVLAVAGTHGKTTTSSMVTWILDCAKQNPGFLIGGVPGNFGKSSRLGSQFFVVEADEYDSAFFDKRSKFIHYRPDIAVLNNLEFDHADIFNSLDDIKKQFHHLVRTVPSNGCIIYPHKDANLTSVLGMGCWSKVTTIGEGGQLVAADIQDAGNSFAVLLGGKHLGRIKWDLIGEYNISNALAAIMACICVGVEPAIAIEALCKFKATARRMELKCILDGVTVYDDFAHHPTAISGAILALKNKTKGRVVAIIDIGSNTMCMGAHKDTLIPAVANADFALLYQSKTVKWNIDDAIAKQFKHKIKVINSLEGLDNKIFAEAASGDNILVMSNQSSVKIHQRLVELYDQKMHIKI